MNDYIQYGRAGQSPIILVIDDDADNLAIVSEYLKGFDFTILVAEDGASGLERAAYAKPDLILLDVLMPGIDGYETCRRLKADDKTRDIPVIFMTALAETEHKVRGFQAGAVDYVTKPFQREEVLARVSVHLQIRELTRKLTEANELLEKRVEQRTAELRNSELRLMEIINFLPDATFAINLKGEIVIWNLTAECLTGAKASDMLGKGDHQYAIPFYGERRATLVDLILNPSCEIDRLYDYVSIEGGVITGECLVRGLPHGEVYFMGKAAPLWDSNGKLAGAIESVRDVTESKKLEEQLRQTQKMEALGALAGGVAHDFNNILTGIMGYATLLKLRMGEGNPLLSFPLDILAAAERAANLTKSLLTFSRKQTISLKPENLNEIVKRIDKLLLRIIGEDLEFRAKLAETPLYALADCGQIEQVLMNLAANARDAMPHGGVLTIATGRIDLAADGDPPQLPSGPYAVIAVSDTGEGMDAATKARIFDPFFTTKEIGKGTGLGLSIVYGIIQQHSGAITVQSDPGKGTTFSIYLRLLPTESESAPENEEAPVPGGSETILLAEDNADARDSMTRVLSEYGYSVIQTVDGEDALEKFQANRDRVAFLLLDVVMPKKDGMAVYREIKAVRPSLPVLFVSGYTEDVIAKKGVVIGTDPFIFKPIPPRILLTRVRELLSR
ncbi:ATP-binding response regulator [Geomonas azotofigens]|uniref:ATP-binding response regulator n=1 Tax=Geomonas azotofigens TaxID=2843196 RepID=UPI001C11EE66|nr:response regulator [Geomonas azotofigens]MBU5613896.1 response regulator [Geomonas azotofigens]